MTIKLKDLLKEYKEDKIPKIYGKKHQFILLNRYTKGGLIYWEVTSNKKWNKDLCFQFQLDMGYHPHGYGLYGYKSKKDNDGEWIMTWSCRTSAD